MNYDWCVLGEPSGSEADIWHIVPPAASKTLCGLDAANPDEEWRWKDHLAGNRPCDNCTRVLAIRVDNEPVRA